jgi:hypothetical protein
MPPRAEFGHIHGRITHEGKRDPMRDAERAALLLHLHELLGIRKIAVQVEEQVSSDMIVTVDEHRGIYDLRLMIYDL